MKKIVFVQDALNGGGAEKILINLLDNINYNKYEVDLLLLFNEGTYIKQLNSNVRLRYILPTLKSKNKIIRKLYYILAKVIISRIFIKLLSFIYLGKKYDIEIGFIEGYSTAIVANSYNKGSKKVCWIHTDLNYYKPIDKKYQLSCYNKIDHIISVSDIIAEGLKLMYPDEKFINKVKTIYNFIDFYNVKYLSEEEFDYNYKYIVAIGRLEEIKGFDKLIEEFSKIYHEFNDLHLVIVGDGSKYNDYINLIKKLKCEKKIHLIGFQSNPYKWIKNSQAVIVSSKVEGMSLVTVESMLLEKCVITSNCGGPVEVLLNGKCGFVLNELSHIELREALNICIHNKDKIKEYIDNCKERVNLFHKSVFFSEFYKIIEGES